MEFDLGVAEGMLARTPPVLRGLLGGLPDALLRANYGPDTWSPHEILAHLIHGE
jgi:hypothetical protein